MKKADKILILALMMLSLLLLIPILLKPSQAKVAVVRVNNKEVYRMDLNKNETIEVQGTLGPVTIETKDGQVRVVDETSPHHVCSYQGYVSNPSTPIICLPNDVVVQIESGQKKEDTTIA
ncbi:MAG: NusG domain II-containing protein [Erysipelotrichaceae bacterium]|nr:NusG domain II-containing protein [Erysipelotrichaceae bacterium]